MSVDRIYSQSWADYELVDAGGGKKLERWGKIYTIRPEVQAYFKSERTFKDWEQLAHWEFISNGGQSGKWKKLKSDSPQKWTMSYKQLELELELTKFKHLGVFPEQQTNWDFIADHLSPNEKFLNLFAYTGAASCVARAAGAETYHVDSVKQLITWARVNMELSGLADIKWVLEDALKFATREQKRGNKYHGIVMDPPAWGLGSKGEKWKLEEKLEELLRTAETILEHNGFLILNTYSPTVDIKLIDRLAKRIFPKRVCKVYELWMKTTTGKELYYGNLLRVN